MMRNLFLAALFMSFGTYAEDYSGLWVWEDNSKKHTFSITLEREGDSYKGSYCAVGMSGSRIDCSPKFANYFTTKLNGDEFSFKTNYSRATGKAKLAISGDALIWEVVEHPRGENYAPKIGTLIKNN